MMNILLSIQGQKTRDGDRHEPLFEPLALEI